MAIRHFLSIISAFTVWCAAMPAFCAETQAKSLGTEALLTAVKRFADQGILDSAKVWDVFDTDFRAINSGTENTEEECKRAPYKHRSHKHLSYLMNNDNHALRPYLDEYIITRDIYCTDPPSAPPEIRAIMTIRGMDLDRCIRLADLQKVFPTLVEEKSFLIYKGPTADVYFYDFSDAGCLPMVRLVQPEYDEQLEAKVEHEFDVCATWATLRYCPFHPKVCLGDIGSEEWGNMLFNACGSLRTRMLSIMGTSPKK